MGKYPTQHHLKNSKFDIISTIKKQEDIAIMPHKPNPEVFLQAIKYHSPLS
jgi:hypothetical protein